MRRLGAIGLSITAGLLAGPSCSGAAERAATPTPADRGPLMVGLPYSPYAHQDEPFAREVFTEQAVEVDQVPDEEVFYVGADADLRHTHVRDLERRSTAAVPGAPVVWFFGGSTMFGIGQRDEHTIPAEVARIAAAAGTPVTVHNFGWSSYVAWQEVGLLRRLVEARGAPDLLVFLHGLNDYSSLCRHLAAGIGPLARTNPQTDAPLADSEPVVDCFADPERTGEVLAGVVEAAMLEVDAMAPGVPVLEFWQPAAYTRAPFPTEQELLEHMGAEAEYFASQREPYLAALGHDRTPPIDLTAVFDELDEPIFFDWAHTNELGARVVADAMWERGIRDAVASLRAGP